MIPIITETLYYVLSYIGIILFIYLGINFLSKGWLTTFIRVKGARGKKLMTIVHSPTDVYFRPGAFIQSGAYTYKTRGKKVKVLTDIPKEAIFPMMGVFCINLNEVKDLAYTYTGEGKALNSGESVDALITEIINTPKLGKDFGLVILIIVILILLAVIADIAMQQNGFKSVQAMCAAARVI